MIHPIKTMLRVYGEILTAVRQLTAAVNAQRTAQLELVGIVEEIARASKQTADSMSYLERSDKHHRTRAGQPVEF